MIPWRDASYTVFLRRIGFVLLMIILTACGVLDQGAQSANLSASETPEPIRPTDTPLATLAATALPPTELPPTSVSDLTDVPLATLEATAFVPAQLPPTQTAIPLSPVAEATATLQATAISTPPNEQARSGEILFLREAALIAYNLDTGQERQIATDVQDFTTTSDGQLLALARDTGQAHELWLLAPSGDELRQVTRNDRLEHNLSFAPDGQTLAYAASTVPLQHAHTWEDWAAWCGASEVRLLDIASGSETTLAPGCDPAFSPDGKRIAFATPPTSARDIDTFPTMNNAIRLVNRQGENGWDFARADGSSEGDDGGLLVYAPTWSPDGSQVAYHRFVGYRALVDLNQSEMGGSFAGNGELLNLGAGWLRPACFAPAGDSLAIVEHNFSDARGFKGYDAWRAQVLDLDDPDMVYTPDGQEATSATVVATLTRVTSAVWLPDTTALVVLLPAGWSADISTDQPAFSDTAPGDLWYWQPGTTPEQMLVEQVDFASPLLWLPG